MDHLDKTPVADLDGRTRVIMREQLVKERDTLLAFNLPEEFDDDIAECNRYLVLLANQDSSREESSS